jgi:U3 small nucleolar RNA-associated protein 4
VSGAGDIIPDSELATGMSRKHQRAIFDKEDKLIGNFVEHRQLPAEMDFDDEDETSEDALNSVLKRLPRGEDAALTNGDSQHTTSLQWWHTYKYRPIMGIVPIGSERAELEVVLVERPTWDMDLPPRYYGDQDWEKSGL